MCGMVWPRGTISLHYSVTTEYVQLHQTSDETFLTDSIHMFSSFFFSNINLSMTKLTKLQVAAMTVAGAGLR